MQQFGVHIRVRRIRVRRVHCVMPSVASIRPPAPRHRCCLLTGRQTSVRPANSRASHSTCHFTSVCMLISLILLSRSIRLYDNANVNGALHPSDNRHYKNAKSTPRDCYQCKYHIHASNPRSLVLTIHQGE